MDEYVLMKHFLNRKMPLIALWKIVIVWANQLTRSKMHQHNWKLSGWNVKSTGVVNNMLVGCIQSHFYYIMSIKLKPLVRKTQLQPILFIWFLARERASSGHCILGYFCCSALAATVAIFWQPLRIVFFFYYKWNVFNFIHCKWMNEMHEQFISKMTAISYGKVGEWE